MYIKDYVCLYLKYQNSFFHETKVTNFTNLGELREHVDRVHLGLKNFVCTECGNRFGSRKVLSKHLRRIHKLTGGAGGIKLDKLSVVTATVE